MAFSKAHLYSDPLFLLSICGKVICHPERLEILRLLRKYGVCSVNELYEHSPLSLSSLSQHLKILRKHEFVSYEEIGPYIYYELNHITIKKHFSAIDRYYRENLD